MSIPMSSPLFAAGPAQNELLIHFTGRPPGLKPTEYVPAHIRGLTPEQRLDAILWEQRILGFVPFGAAPPHAMVSLSRVHSTIWPGSSTSAAGLRGASSCGGSTSSMQVADQFGTPGGNSTT
jgi:hypothetical protein